jgi:prophage antirepressor-like protein
MSKKQTNMFFMEIFNDILKINDTNVIIIYDTDGNIWFGLKDIIKSLGYSNIQKAMANIKTSINNKKLYSNLYPTPTGEGSLYNINKDILKPNKLFINEAGLYEVLSISTKPQAKLFMDKYFTDIMPTIRKTGSYKLHKSDKLKLDKVNKKFYSIKKSNKSLLNNQRNIIYPDGNALYVITKIINKKKYYKIGYTKNLNKRLKVYNTGEPHKILFNYYLMVKNKEIDNCIKTIMKNEEFIKNKEYYMTTLNKILRFISKCDTTLNKINCGYCLELYDFDIIKDHKCKYI